jgi:hypothetical protein
MMAVTMVVIIIMVMTVVVITIMFIALVLVLFMSTAFIFTAIKIWLVFYTSHKIHRASACIVVTTMSVPMSRMFRRDVKINWLLYYVTMLNNTRASVYNLRAGRVTKLDTTINTRLYFACQNYINIHTSSMGNW